MSSTKENKESKRIREEEVYYSLRDFVKTVLDKISKSFEDGYVPKKTSYKVRKEDQGMSWESYEVTHWKRLAYSIQNTFNKFTGYSDCVSTLLSNPKMKEYLPGEGDESYIKQILLPEFISEYLRKKENLEFEEDSFKALYLDFEDYLFARSLSYQAWTLLKGFEMEHDKIKLEDNLIIRKTTEAELSFLLTEARTGMSSLKTSDILKKPNRFVIETKFSVQKDDSKREKIALRRFDSVVLALRIFSGEDVNYQYRITEPLNEYFGSGKTISVEHGKNPVSKFYLSSKRCEGFKDFWNKHREIFLEKNIPKQLNIAFKRFSFALDRKELEDRLIDLIVSLESLYLKSGEIQELSYRLSQRGALLLGETKEEKTTIKETIKEAYNLRSKIVHGVGAKVDKEFLSEIQSLVRKSLVKFLNFYMADVGFDEILDKLDQKALSVNNTSLTEYSN